MVDEMSDPTIGSPGERDLRALQEVRWRAQRDRVAAWSAFYRRTGRAFDGVGLDGLVAVEPTRKEELLASQAEYGPFGDYLACDERELRRIHRTSGLTGRGLVLAQTAADTAVMHVVGGRSMLAAGLERTDRVVHCLNYRLWTGGLTDHLILEAAGATVVPFGVGDTRLLIETILELGVTAISCTPSYPALIEKVLRAETNFEPRDLGLRIGLFGGEPGIENPDFRSRIEETFGMIARNANFGLSEVLSILGGQCDASGDLHFHAGDAVFAELLEPTSGERVEITEGAVGELVLTHLLKEAQPLVRYRSGDVVSITGTGLCACGRTSFRFRMTGRADDMFNVRGVNIFPTAVREIIDGQPTLTSGHFRIVIRGPGPYDRVEIKAEAAESVPQERYDEIAGALEAALRDGLRASAVVSVVPHGSLGRTAEKTSLIERVPA